MPKKGDKMVCKDCGTEVVCTAGSGCGVEHYLVCCGGRMRKVPAEGANGG